MNERSPWATYHALMDGGLISLDKHLGVRTVGVGENWWMLVVKCVLKVAVQESKEACITDQLCVGVMASIKSSIYTIFLL